MTIIPVIDLMDGRVVHARRGERDRYAPLDSALVDGCEPDAVLDALLTLHPFPSVYIADLDAIRGRGENAATIVRLHRRHPHLELWVDAGFRGPQRLPSSPAGTPVRPVIGTECVDAAWPQGRLRDWHSRAILSLDFQAAGPLGPPQLWRNPQLWPEQVIVMALSRVGSGTGPAVQELAELHARAPEHRLYAAGGVRHAGDLAALRTAAAAGALEASALHDGSIGAEQLAQWQ